MRRCSSWAVRCWRRYVSAREPSRTERPWPSYNRVEYQGNTVDLIGVSNRGIGEPAAATGASLAQITREVTVAIEPLPPLATLAMLRVIDRIASDVHNEFLAAERKVDALQIKLDQLSGRSPRYAIHRVCERRKWPSPGLFAYAAGWSGTTSFLTELPDRSPGRSAVSSLSSPRRTNSNDALQSRTARRTSDSRRRRRTGVA